MGLNVDAAEGVNLGSNVGTTDRVNVGSNVGTADGVNVGSNVGSNVGAAEGVQTTHWDTMWRYGGSSSGQIERQIKNDQFCVLCRCIPGAIFILACCCC